MGKSEKRGPLRSKGKRCIILGANLIVTRRLKTEKSRTGGDDNVDSKRKSNVDGFFD